MAKEQLSPETALKVQADFPGAARKSVSRLDRSPGAGALVCPLRGIFHVVPELDLHVGGKYRVEMHHKGGNVHSVSGTYREIKPPEKVAFTWIWEHDPGKSESLVTVEFRDLGPSTEILLSHEQLPNAEQRGKHEHGWNGCLDQLANYLNM